MLVWCFNTMERNYAYIESEVRFLFAGGFSSFFCILFHINHLFVASSIARVLQQEYAVYN